MNQRKVIRCLLIFLFFLFLQIVSQNAICSEKPNIIFILADDLGCGDVSCYNSESKIRTPNIDRLANEGIIFTDAHSSSAVCSPTRYSIMTGRYNWRSKLQSGVLGGLSPRLIEKDRLTVAKMLHQNGYYTACIGKWHLGMDWTLFKGKKVNELGIENPNQVWNVDYSKPIKNSPNSVGFDYYFGISASLDMVPYTFIENDRVVELPITNLNFPMMYGKDNQMTRLGPAAKGFNAEQVLPTLTKNAIEFIKEHKSYADRGKPFFLYLAFASPHTPILPDKKWLGKSGINPYCDFVMATDDSVGQILNTIDELGISTNTIVFFASDNGCSPSADYKTLLSKGHNPSYKYRGTKADIFEGGHRIPLIVKWKGKIKPGERYDETVCLVDFMATCADLLKIKLPENSAEDSVSILPALFYNIKTPLREATVHHSINGSFAIRQGKWKLILCPDSGGWSEPRPANKKAGKLTTNNLPQVQLYNLENDIGETNNLYAKCPDIVKKLDALLERYVNQGRSTPGKPQKNEVAVNIWKFSKKIEN